MKKYEKIVRYRVVGYLIMVSSLFLLPDHEILTYVVLGIGVLVTLFFIFWGLNVKKDVNN